MFFLLQALAISVLAFATLNHAPWRAFLEGVCARALDIATKFDAQVGGPRALSSL